MKIFFLIIVFLSSFLVLKSQHVATSFNEIKKTGVRFSQLDSVYKNALGSNPTEGVFNSQADSFYKAYVTLLTDLSVFLKKNNFKWGKTTHCFNRIYFKHDGSIDYFLYNFKDPSFSNEQLLKFDELLKKFVQDYRLSMSALVNFAQCSPVTYKDE